MKAVYPFVEREDVDAILSGIFDVSTKLEDIRTDIRAIRAWLEDGDEQEEEEEAP